jgi:hypothetical protein
MIDHVHRCIFVHIPRCAGTSVETWLVGSDWWLIEPQTKHLLASQARRVYAEWWDRYFKFSVVREPLRRCVSLLKYADFYGLERRGDAIDFAGYHARFGADVVVEADYRFHAREDATTPRHRPGRVYGNILDEELDFVARYETLGDDMRRVAEAIGARTPFTAHVERSGIDFEPDAATRAHVRALYRDDYRRFGYEA